MMIPTNETLMRGWYKLMQSYDALLTNYSAAYSSEEIRYWGQRQREATVEFDILVGKSIDPKTV